MRAFRPSYFSSGEAEEEVIEQARQENVLVYRRRVAAGLPLFEQLRMTTEPETPGSGPSFAH